MAGIIRSAPTLTACTTCGNRMAAIRGPYSKSIGRPNPPAGYRLGYVMETAGREIPICAECLHLILTTAAQESS